MNEELLNLKDKIVVVSKNRTMEDMEKLYELGFRTFGENRVQELLTKTEFHKEDAVFHLIGHLQTNKAAQAVKYTSLIHSADSYKLIKEINKQAYKLNKVMPILIQVNVAEEETKFGIKKEELFTLIEECSSFENISIQGIMVIGPHTDDTDKIDEVFKEGKELFNQGFNIKQSNVSWQTLSMGMSSDYQIALKNGSTLLRLGRIMFE